MLRVRLLGQFDVRVDDKRVLIPSRAGQSLMAYLLLTARTTHRREKLAGLLWPDTSDENARKLAPGTVAHSQGASAVKSPTANTFWPMNSPSPSILKPITGSMWRSSSGLSAAAR